MVFVQGAVVFACGCHGGVRAGLAVCRRAGAVGGGGSALRGWCGRGVGL